jgi:hypothetical protein
MDQQWKTARGRRDPARFGQLSMDAMIVSADIAGDRDLAAPSRVGVPSQ